MSLYQIFSMLYYLPFSVHSSLALLSFISVVKFTAQFFNFPHFFLIKLLPHICSEIFVSHSLNEDAIHHHPHYHHLLFTLCSEIFRNYYDNGLDRAFNIFAGRRRMPQKMEQKFCSVPVVAKRRRTFLHRDVCIIWITEINVLNSLYLALNPARINKLAAF